MPCQGLADEAEVAQDAPSPKTLQDPQLEQMSSGRIGAFYPDDGHAKVNLLLRISRDRSLMPHTETAMAS